MFYNQQFDFLLQRGNFTYRQRNLALPLSWPNQRPIKRLRCQIRRKKRDGIKSGASWPPSP